MTVHICDDKGSKPDDEQYAARPRGERDFELYPRLMTFPLISQSNQTQDETMSTEVLFPKIGFSMSEGTLSEWLVSDGAAVNEGQPIYSLESEKSIQEVESPASGTLNIIGKPGEVYPVGAVVAKIG